MPTKPENTAALLSLFMVLLLDVMGVVLVMPVLTPLLLQPGNVDSLISAASPFDWRFNHSKRHGELV